MAMDGDRRNIGFRAVRLQDLRRSNRVSKHLQHADSSPPGIFPRDDARRVRIGNHVHGDIAGVVHKRDGHGTMGPIQRIERAGAASPRGGVRAEQAKQRILAANMERDRISESIQSEVTMTLTSVIDQAVAGLRMLDDCERHGEQPSPGAISEAFAAIGSQGRAALAHMRKLLGVLRETGFSDEAHRQEQPGMQLRPAASLDKQLHDSQLHGIAS